MALPYPSMDFVPFDILTAQELDQVVANIEALAAGTAIANNAIMAPALSASAISLGYASAVASQTIATSAATAVTGLSTSVTLPAGGRNIEVKASISYATSGAAANFITVELLNGATIIRATRVQVPLNGSTGPINLERILVAPAAGIQTYSLRVTQDSGTGVDYIASATSPNYITVRAV